MFLDTGCHDNAGAKIARTNMASVGKYLAATSSDDGTGLASCNAPQTDTGILIVKSRVTLQWVANSCMFASLFAHCYQ